MFDIAPSELLLIAAIAIVVIPPKDLPRAMRTVGQWVGRARGMARHFRSGIDEMIRQSELDEMEKKWRDENARIMAEHPMHALHDGVTAPASLPAPNTAPVPDDVAAEVEADAATGSSEDPVPHAQPDRVHDHRVDADPLPDPQVRP